ncbi:WD40 domain-containing protein [Cephalotus follicularis]|uniref:WD40 domain-containing protein n=1 Tax=Cephalotus follicularis TaxID=3775 RepID=A0A1Q3B4W6_CEPFO|nr:WD40 domain-containing protein [Cephalotus follicularis]
MTGRPLPHDHNSLQSPPSNHLHLSGRNVYSLIARREISPRKKYVPKNHWGEAFKCNASSSSWPRTKTARDAKRGLISWVEAESLRHLSAKYCPLVPPPRSTIAAAFSSNGTTIASTHGDHTVKIIDCQTGICLKVLSGHRRTPWVVRFHPLHPEILASGSLDHEVRLWDANTSECIGSRDFYRPIASIAFHAEGELLAVASGHKLYIWQYDKRGEASSPNIVLKTRRSLRAVHFHPHAAPFLLTAEVNDLDSSDSSMTRATSPGYLRYPPPAVFVANVHTSERVSLPDEVPLPFLVVPSFSIDDSRTGLYANRHVDSSSMQGVPSASMQFQTDANSAEQYDNTVSPMEMFPVSLHTGTEDTVNNSFPNGMGSGVSGSPIDAMDTEEMQRVDGSQQGSSTNVDTLAGALSGVPGHIVLRPDLTEFVQLQPLRDPTCWELPFLQGWLMGQGQTGVPSLLPHNVSSPGHLAQYVGSSSLSSNLPFNNVEAAVASLAIPGSVSLSGVSVRSGLRNRILCTRFSVSESAEGTVPMHSLQDGSDTQPIISRIQYELATSLAAAAAAELPCTVKLRVWSHDIKNPCAPLNTERCRLTIPHAVLCSEMGAHFSPCGRFLAACVACMLPHMEADPGIHTLVHQDPGAGTSPTRHPISAHQVMYELRIYSLEEASFGSVLVSRAIRAAHCLTSIQFSPTSEHILLAYGRRHGSLLKSIVIDGESTSPIYTVLEVYRVSDMELVRVLPSAEDEVNVACFHPFAGGGLVYGTKEGKLRVLQYDGAHEANRSGQNYFLEENMAELQTYALEC